MLAPVIDNELAVRYHRLGYWEDLSFGDYLSRNTAQRPDHLAVIDSNQAVTWRELSERVERTAVGLAKLGVRPRDTVAIQLPNRVEFFYLRIAVQRLGARALTIAPDLREHELVPALRRTSVRVMVAPLEYRSFNYLEMLERLREQVPSLEHYVLLDGGKMTAAPSVSEWVARVPTEAERSAVAGPGVGPNEVDLVMFTSGTTGLPKLYARTANIFCYRGRTMNESIGLTENDRLMSLAPITQGIGQLFGLACFMVSGATLVLQERFQPEDALAAIKREKVDVVGGVPTHALRMISSSDAHLLKGSRLRLIVLGGAACPPAKQREIEAVLGCNVLNYYGMGEIGIPAIPNAEDPPVIRHESSGRLLQGMEIQVIDSGGQPLPMGEVGEVLVRGPGVSLGYVDDDEANSELFDREGWGHSGDLGYVDGEGILHIVGRKKELIIRGGLNIVPKELEDLIAGHPSVRQVAVIGLPDPDLGERACAVLVLHPGHGLPLGELVDFLRAHGISTYKLPERLAIVDEMPVNAIGKTDKRGLQSRLATEAWRESEQCYDLRIGSQS